MSAFHTTVALVAQLLAGQSGPAALTAVGLVGVTLLVLAWALGRPARVPAVTIGGRGRPRAAHAVFVRLRHPAAPGRPRPRAPSAGPAHV
ncbi:DUF6412 domain-containing protein [Sphaerisporangium siamense]|uniref:Uncharacterized protein n=1 Tax=Sphaerisporangium siamense TaxID=795645 RepID=A0A7W7D638_9ACTN|nr:DUF6412 domain-containing protein [Sphaerisporangium siamense]MBB4700010.1 hypothetical protein [Sphaerisporangium siamense]